MRLAIIDLGTNSVRFDVHELGPDGEIYKLHREKLMIRLGEGVFLKERLDAKSTRVCIDVFKSFKKTIDDFKVHRVVAFATSALREARDGDKLIRDIKRKTGIQVRIISGEEEARLIARGVLSNEISLRGRLALVDIGGGSTEVAICNGKNIMRVASFPLGTARLQQIFLKTIPPAAGKGKKTDAIENLRRHIRGVLLYRLVEEDWPKASRIIGSSGTVRALSKIVKKVYGSQAILRKELAELVQSMSTMTRSELLKAPGMESHRVDMILAGAILLQECMNAIHADRVEGTEFSLRDGILDEQFEYLHEQKKLLVHDPIRDLYETALELNGDENQIKQGMSVSSTLFDKFRALHRMKPQWKQYLVAASILHDTGRTISPINSEAHAGYIAKFADVPVFEDWESKLISELCLRHKNGKLLKKDLPFKKNKPLLKVYVKLLAILRLSSAFSFQRQTPVIIDKVKIEPKRVTLLISKRNSPQLAVLRADQRKQLFEEVFRRELTIEYI